MTAAELLETALREKRKAALSDTQAQILLHLAKAGEPQRARWLADALCVAPQSIYEALDGMPEAVRVDRVPRVSVLVSLRAEGVRLVMLLLGKRENG